MVTFHHVYSNLFGVVSTVYIRYVNMWIFQLWIFQLRPRNTKFMAREKVAGALHFLKPILTNSFRPYRADLNLVKGGVSVKLREPHVPGEGVQAIIYKRQWKYVLPCHIVQAPVIQAPPYLISNGGDAHADIEGWITPASSIFLK